MDNFDNNRFHSNRATAPENMYQDVRNRIVQECIRMAKTRRQLAVGSALLLIVGVLNVSIIVFSKSDSAQTSENTKTQSTEQVLYETYFDNQISLNQ